MFPVRLICGTDIPQELSAKVSTLAHLSSEQLSQQPHYDFGMRAVKSVLMFAGQMKRNKQSGTIQSEEDVLIQASGCPDLRRDLVSYMSGKARADLALDSCAIVILFCGKHTLQFPSTSQPRARCPLQALCSSNLPKLLERDTPLFIAILGDLFPRKSLPVPSHDSLHRGIEAAAKEMGLQSLKEQTTKVDQLHETMEVSGRIWCPVTARKRVLLRNIGFGPRMG